MDLFGTDPLGADLPRSPGTPPARHPPSPKAPLAERLRPATLDTFAGQEDVVGPGRPLRVAIEEDRLHSLIFWGPPGSGKTTLARIVAGATRSQFISFSAVLSGIKEIKEVMRGAEACQSATGRRTVLFIDEIHRFNRAQQDAFLPYVERGTIILIGATTENPSFEVNAALLSRCAVYVLRRLDDTAIVGILKRALQDPSGLPEARLQIGEDDLAWLAAVAGGDARRALNTLEVLAETTPKDATGARPADRTSIAAALQRAPLLYDKSGEEHYNLISALHKSLRNSDVDATLYWLARMIESGEDPLYVARRLVRFASEDVGNADPQAIGVAIAARDAFEFLGLPEGSLALAQAAAYLATAPKSNALYAAWGAIREDLGRGLTDPVPLQIRNAPTRLMKGLGYGRDYQYAHDFEEGTTPMECLPDRLRGRRYYRPRPVGYERTIGDRLREIEEARRRMRSGKGRESGDVKS